MCVHARALPCCGICLAFTSLKSETRCWAVIYPQPPTHTQLRLPLCLRRLDSQVSLPADGLLVPAHAIHMRRVLFLRIFSAAGAGIASESRTAGCGRAQDSDAAASGRAERQGQSHSQTFTWPLLAVGGLSLLFIIFLLNVAAEGHIYVPGRFTLRVFKSLSCASNYVARLSFVTPFGLFCMSYLDSSVSWRNVFWTPSVRWRAPSWTTTPW